MDYLEGVYVFIRRPACGQAMVRIGEDVSERLDIVPAEFFVQRHVRGTWACKCCQQKGEGRLVQEPAEPQIIDKGMPTSGLLAHTLVSRFVDHLPYYRQEQINARAGETADHVLERAKAADFITYSKVFDGVLVS